MAWDVGEERVGADGARPLGRGRMGRVALDVDLAYLCVGEGQRGEGQQGFQRRTNVRLLGDGREQLGRLRDGPFRSPWLAPFREDLAEGMHRAQVVRVPPVRAKESLRWGIKVRRGAVLGEVRMAAHDRRMTRAGDSSSGLYESLSLSGRYVCIDHGTSLFAN